MAAQPAMRRTRPQNSWLAGVRAKGPWISSSSTRPAPAPANPRCAGWPRRVRCRGRAWPAPASRCGRAPGAAPPGSGGSVYSAPSVAPSRGAGGRRWPGPAPRRWWRWPRPPRQGQCCNLCCGDQRRGPAHGGGVGYCGMLARNSGQRRVWESPGDARGLSGARAEDSVCGRKGAPPLPGAVGRLRTVQLLAMAAREGEERTGLRVRNGRHPGPRLTPTFGNPVLERFARRLNGARQAPLAVVWRGVPGVHDTGFCAMCVDGQAVMVVEEVADHRRCEEQYREVTEACSAGVKQQQEDSFVTAA